ncbi:unnamed protein product [Hymenolepis diminuta]|uniref:Uncharacterized protein n=1 Tax=Hymenolepis diminuta TaxID=6216 RepID=A0A564ZAP0_HYMDI|nr:unnamed protein product [Hymenolepis diminuta]
MVCERTVRIHGGAGIEQSYFKLDEYRIYRVSSYTYIDFSASEKDSADDATRLNIMKVKKRLVMPRPDLGSKVLLIRTRAKLPEQFVESVLLHCLFTSVHCKVDDKKLKVVRNTVWWIILDPYSRRQMNDQMTIGNISLKNLAT